MAIGKGFNYEGQLLNLLFAAKAIVGVADNTAAAPLTGLWCALHATDPSTTGQTGGAEGGYTAYTRVLTTRSTAGFSLTSGTSTTPATISPVAAINFPQCATTSTGTFAFCSFGSTSSGVGQIFYVGAISPTINYGNGVTPQISTGSSITEL